MDFKQIIGRGHAVLEEKGKFWFTIIDYVGATRLFYDPDFDGEPEIDTIQKVNSAGEVTETAERTHPEPDRAGGGESEYAPADGPESGAETQERRKYYLDGLPVYIIGEQVFELDPETRTCAPHRQFTDYVRENIRRLADRRAFAPGLATRRAASGDCEQCSPHGGSIWTNWLSVTHHADADPLDLLLNVAYNAPLVSRKERASKLRQSKPNFFNAYQAGGAGNSGRAAGQIRGLWHSASSRTWPLRSRCRPSTHTARSATLPNALWQARAVKGQAVEQDADASV